MKAIPVVFMAAALVAALGLAGPARTQVKVVGGPLAVGCSQLAIGGSKELAAVNICSRALDSDATLSQTDAAKTLVNRGVIQMRRGQLDDAEKDFASAQRTMPQLAEIYVNRGVSLIRQGKWHEALAQLDRGIQLNPWEPEKAYFDRALTREALGDVSGARADYAKAAELKPEWAKPATELKRVSANGPAPGSPTVR